MSLRLFQLGVGNERTTKTEARGWRTQCLILAVGGRTEEGALVTKKPKNRDRRQGVG